MDDYFKNEVFKPLQTNAQVHIILAFGKNKEDKQKSFKKKEIEYFTQFPNITIVYLKNLHAKYYCNENKSVITSMNLISYSFKNNIEFGVLADNKMLSTNKLYDTSKDEIYKILVEHGTTIFVRRPRFKKKKMFGKDYIGSETELNLIQELLDNKPIKKIDFSQYTNEKYITIDAAQERISREEFEKKSVPLSKNKTPKYNKSKSSTSNYAAYCIRCKESIKRNIDRPFCWKCYQIWEKYSDSDYQENYCHACGQEKKTSHNKPVCYTCYKKNNY